MASTIITSTVTGGSNSHQTVAEEINNVQTDFVTQGVVGSFTSGSPNTGAFGVTQDASPDMGITVIAGRAYVSATPAGQDAQVLSVRMSANYTTYTINANASGSTKFDWIYLKTDATKANNPALAADDVTNLFTSRSTSNASDNGSPPTYGLLLAVVTVANGASSITNGNITDKRVQANLSVQSSGTTGWNTLSFPLTYGANNGSKEFTTTTPNDITGTVTPGMKLKITRSVTPPTQCMAFTAASSQYATKASPSGISFTGAFTTEAWIYLNSYPATSAPIVNRDDNSANGWCMDISSNGQIRSFWRSGANTDVINSSQSVPLKTWLHIATVSTPSSQSSLFYVNATAVSSNSPSASGATTVSQGAGALQVGGRSSASQYFDGYISEVRVWSVARTPQQIADNMAINLVGNETNLVALFQGSGNFTDSTSNNNTLTATNGAIATQANNPYNATEYFSIIAATYSNPTTTLILDGGTTNMLPNQTLNSPNYSTAKNPLGLPINLTKYVRKVINCSSPTTTSTSIVQVPGQTITMTIPTGTPTVRISSYCTAFSSSAGTPVMGIVDGTIPGGTLIEQFNNTTGSSAAGVHMSVPVNPTSGSHTFGTGFYNTSGTVTFGTGVPNPGYLFVECDI